jgi:hypothetical protein
MNNVSARLVLRYGKTNLPEYRLTDRPMTLGREAINDIILSDPEISRRHARIFRQDEVYLLEDLGSTNGTFINGRRIHAPTILKDEDVMEFGESIRLQFLLMADEAVEEAPATMVMEEELPPVAAARRGPTKPLPDPDLLPEPTDTELLTPLEEPRRSSRGRILFGCGCLVIIVLFICATTIFILDSQFPNVLYCGPLQGLFELLQPLNCPIQ